MGYNKSRVSSIEGSIFKSNEFLKPKLETPKAMTGLSLANYADVMKHHKRSAITELPSRSYLPTSSCQHFLFRQSEYDVNEIMGGTARQVTYGQNEWNEEFDITSRGPMTARSLAGVKSSNCIITTRYSNTSQKKYNANLRMKSMALKTKMENDPLLVDDKVIFYLINRICKEYYNYRMLR